MPRLPDVSSVSRVSSSALRVPAIRGPNSAPQARALEATGDLVFRVTERFQDANDTTAANTALFESAAKLQDIDSQLRTSGDVGNAVQSLQKSFQEIVADQKGKLSGRAFSKFSSAFGSRFLSARASLSNFARTKQIEGVKASTENILTQSLDEASKAENVESPIMFGRVITGPARDALDEAVRVGAFSADEAEKKFTEFEKDVRARAISGFIERSPSYLHAFRALEGGDTGNENLNDELAKMSPEERLKVKRSSLKALNERKTLERSIREDRERELESQAEALEVRFYTTDDPLERGQILGQLEALARTSGGITSSGSDIKTLRDFHASAGLEGGARDDPDVVRRLQAGLISGEFQMGDVLRASPFLTQGTSSRLMTIAGTQRNRRAATGARIIRNSFGILKDTVISDRSQAVVMQAAGDALVLYDQILADPDNKEDPVALATRLAKQGKESVAQVRIRNAISSLDVQLSKHGISVKNFDLQNRKTFNDRLKEALDNSDLSQSERAWLGVVIGGQINTIFGSD